MELGSHGRWFAGLVRARAARGPPLTTSAQGPDGERKQVVIYTDGACLGNPGPGGYGIVLRYGSAMKELSAGYQRTTNNRMELLGPIVALEALKEPATVVLHSDSEYLVKAMTLGWATKWRANGWRLASRQPAANVDLWERLLALTERHTVDFRWVKGHAGDPDNERCDQLAMQAALTDAVRPDDGYRPQPKASPARSPRRWR